MKRGKIAAVLALCVMALVVVAACAQQIPIVGQWTMTGAKTNGVEVNLSELAEQPEYAALSSLQIVFDFKDDGTASMSLGGEDVGASLTYKVDGDNVTIEGDGQQMVMTYDKDAKTLTWNSSEVTGQDITIILTKSGS